MGTSRSYPGWDRTQFVQRHSWHTCHSYNPDRSRRDRLWWSTHFAGMQGTGRQTSGGHTWSTSYLDYKGTKSSCSIYRKAHLTFYTNTAMSDGSCSEFTAQLPCSQLHSILWELQTESTVASARRRVNQIKVVVRTKANLGCGAGEDARCFRVFAAPPEDPSSVSAHMLPAHNYL